MNKIVKLLEKLIARDLSLIHIVHSVASSKVLHVCEQTQACNMQNQAFLSQS